MKSQVWKISELQDGKTIILQFAEIARDGVVPSDYFKTSDGKIRSRFENFDNVAIEFDKNQSWAEMEKLVFRLDRSFKTIGTYITKINKIGNGINPSSKTSYAKKSASTGTGKIGIERQDSTVRIFTIDNPDSWAAIEFLGSGEIGKIEIVGNFERLSYYILALVNPEKFRHRLARLVEFVDGQKCAEPEYIFQLDEFRFVIGPNLPADLTPLVIKFSDYLIRERQFGLLAQLENIKPIMTGGGEKWLIEFLISMGMLEKTHPLNTN